MSNYQGERIEPQTPAPKKGGLSPKLLTGIVAVVLLGALGVGAAVFLPTLFQSKQNIPGLMGGDTQLYASINPNLSAIKGLRNLQSAFANISGDSTDNTQDLNSQVADQLGVDYQADVQPWLGDEMAVGLSGVEKLNEDGVENLPSQVKTVFVLATKDKAKSEAFLQKLRDKQQTDGAYTDEDYKGVKLASRARADAAAEKPLNAMGIVGDYVVIGSDAETVKALIDRADSKQNTLAANPRFTAVINGLPKTAVGYVYVDGLAISEGVNSALEDQLGDLEGAQRDQVEKNLQTVRALEGFGASISVLEKGIAIDSDVKLDLTKIDATTKAQIDATKGGVKADVLGTISQAALGSITGNIPTTFKQQILDLINAQPESKEQLTQFEEQLGISLERDLLDWFLGDFALVALPSDEAMFPNAPATGYFSLRTPAKDKAEAGLKNIEAAVLKMGAGIEFDDATLGGQSWRTIKDPDAGETIVGYGFMGDDLVIGVGEAALTEVPNGSKQPLVNDANFKDVQANLPTTNGGVFFFNLPKIAEVAAKVQGQTLDEFYASDEGKNFKPFKGIGIAGEPGLDGTGLGKARVFVLISE